MWQPASRSLPACQPPDFPFPLTRTLSLPLALSLPRPLAYVPVPTPSPLSPLAPRSLPSHPLTSPPSLSSLHPPYQKSPTRRLHDATRRARAAHAHAPRTTTMRVRRIILAPPPPPATAAAARSMPNPSRSTMPGCCSLSLSTLPPLVSLCSPLSFFLLSPPTATSSFFPFF